VGLPEPLFNTIMGYDTYYQIEIQPDPEDYDVNSWKAQKLEAKLCGDLTLEQHKEQIGFIEENTRWQEMEEEMSAYSLKYPEILFIVHGEGEESQDLWRHYFKNGKSWETRAQIVYEDFKEEYLE